MVFDEGQREIEEVEVEVFFVRLGGKIELLMIALLTSRSNLRFQKPFERPPLSSRSSGTHLDALHDVVKRADARVDLCGVLWWGLILVVDDGVFIITFRPS